MMAPCHNANVHLKMLCCQKSLLHPCMTCTMPKHAMWFHIYHVVMPQPPQRPAQTAQQWQPQPATPPVPQAQWGAPNQHPTAFQPQRPQPSQASLQGSWPQQPPQQAGYVNQQQHSQASLFQHQPAAATQSAGHALAGYGQAPQVFTPQAPAAVAAAAPPPPSSQVNFLALPNMALLSASL